MTISTKTVVKTYFETGDFPTQSNFTDLIDSFLGLGETASQTIQGPIVVSGQATMRTTTIVSGQAQFYGDITMNANAVSAAKSTMGLGTVVTYNVGVSANNIPQLDSSNRLPAVNGSLLTGIVTGGPVLLATNTPSGAVSTSFSSTYITSTYKSYEIRMYGVFASGGAGVDLYLTISVDNGSNYLSANYGWDVQVVGNTSSNDSKINITGQSAFISATANLTSDGIITLYNPSGTRYFSCDWKIHSNNIAGMPGGHISSGSGANSGTTAINNIKLALNGQNINGTFELWGIP